MFQIDLTPSGELQLHMPNHCAIEVQATVEGLQFIKKVILDHQRQVRNQPAYIGTLPTQHAVNKFLKEKSAKIAKEKADEIAGKANKLGIDYSKLEISI
jgi:hypothetical protein